MVTHSPRPPPGYSALAVSPSQILLQLTISNKCGQAFRWRATDVYELCEDSDETLVKDEEYVKKEIEINAQPIVKQENDLPSPATTFTSRSAHTYRKTTEWSMCLVDRVVFVRQDEERGFIYYKTVLPSDQQLDAEVVQRQTEAWLRDYLNLEVPLTSLYDEWSSKDAVFARFAARFSGVRMLRQDPWETLCAFICSSNNNIARIGQMVQNLCTHFSEPIASVTYPPPPPELSLNYEDDDVQATSTTIHYHPFPSVERLAHKDVEAKLRNLAFGYRSRYIQETAQMLLDIVQESQHSSPPLSPSSSATPPDAYATVDEYLGSIRRMDYGEARNQLIRFPGVGPKVADCILLMAMDQPSSIPVDRHVFQFAERWYGIRTKGGLKGYERIAEAFRQLWGPYAGWAHSVLFTADLRAFQTYKKEEVAEKKLLDDEDVMAKERKVHVQQGGSREANTTVKIEAREKISTSGQVHIDSPRAIRWKKRVYDQHVGSDSAANEKMDTQQEITKTFKSTKQGRIKVEQKES